MDKKYVEEDFVTRCICEHRIVECWEYEDALRHQISCIQSSDLPKK